MVELKVNWVATTAECWWEKARCAGLDADLPARVKDWLYACAVDDSVVVSNRDCKAFVVWAQTFEGWRRTPVLIRDVSLDSSH